MVAGIWVRPVSRGLALIAVDVVFSSPDDTSQWLVHLVVATNHLTEIVPGISVGFERHEFVSRSASKT